MDEYERMTEAMREAVRERMAAERLPLERAADLRDLEKIAGAERKVAELAESFRAAKRKGAKR